MNSLPMRLAFLALLLAISGGAAQAGDKPPDKVPKDASLDFQDLLRRFQGVSVSGDPDAARLITTDIDNFWRAYDQATPKNLAEVLERDYLKPGSPGLRDFVRLRISSAERLAETISAHPKYYASIRDSTKRVATMEKRIRAGFYALKHLHAEAVFPDVYFVIGRMTSGGTTSTRGLLIGMEMHSRTPQAHEAELSAWHKNVLTAVENVPFIVAHELIHYQQKHPPKLKPSLLSQSITEGGADFLGELIAGGHINQHLHVYGNPRERELWEEFRKVMDGGKYTGWLYDGAAIKDRPADLGYYMGYKIVAAHYEQAKDKRQAIKEILTIQDFGKFLKESNYEARLEKGKAPGK